MKPVAFQYHRATSAADAVKVLQSDPESKIIAGGQSLIPVMNFRLSRPSVLVDINGIDEMRTIEKASDSIHVGASVRHQELLENEIIQTHLPVLSKAVQQVGHWAIRNRGTMGGSLTHADPAAELPAAALALHAQIHIEGVEGKQTVSAEEFYLGIMTTVLQPDEIVTSIEVPLPDKQVYGFSEFARRPGDFALAGAYCEIQESGQGAVTWFGVSDCPERRELELNDDESKRMEVFKQLAQELEPLDEPEYRKHLAVLAAEQAYQDAKGGRI